MLSDPSAEAARRVASAILEQRRFHSPSVPRPLHGLLHAVGTALTACGRAVLDVVNKLGTLFPGGALAVWIVLGTVLITASVLLAGRYAKRAVLEGNGAASAGAESPQERAGALEQAAERAERAGRLAEAVRLRFRAGLARLSERGMIGGARSTPTAEISRTLRSPGFDALAQRFDEIAYGASAAGPADVEQARSTWPVVVRGAERG